MAPADASSQKALLNALDQALNATANDQTEEKAAIHLKKALIATALGDWSQAADALAQVAILAQQEDQPLPQAQALYAQGILHQLQAQGQADGGKATDGAEASLTRAAELFQTIGQGDRAAAIQQDLQGEQAARRQKLQALADDPDAAQTLLTSPDLLEAVLQDIQHMLRSIGDTFQTLIDTPWLADQPAARVELYCLRAQWHQVMEDAAAAEADWNAALEQAQALKNAALVERVQAQRSGGNAFGLPRFDPLSLAEMGLQSGPLPLEHDTLHRAVSALRQHDWETLLTHARALRQESLHRTSADRYALYFFACLLEALGYEGQERDVDALESLLRCKATLDQSAVSELGQQVNQFVYALRQRWGIPRYEAARLTFRQKFANATPPCDP